MYKNIIPKTAVRDICTERKPILCALFEFHSRVYSFTICVYVLIIIIIISINL
jgi:hypothetical protein